MNTTTRTSRATKSRAAEEGYEEREINFIDDIDFSPANLDTKNIPPREGYDQRWVRIKIGSEDDSKNVFRMANMGWQPRKADTVKKASMVPTVNFNGDNIIGVYDTILMERPDAIGKKQRTYEDDLSNRQIDAAKHDVYSVHDKNSGLTKPEYNSQSKVSRGRIAPVAAD